MSIRCTNLVAPADAPNGGSACVLAQLFIERGAPRFSDNGLDGAQLGGSSATRLPTTYAHAAPKADRRWESAGLALLTLPSSAIGATVRGHLEAMYVLPLPVMTAAAFFAGQVASEVRAASAAREALMREAEQQRVLTEERMRIARELHDVILHSIATIGVQAGVTAHVWDQQPDQAREALLTIKDLSRSI